MQCLYCQKEITGERNTKKYCDDSCKLKANRLKVSVSKATAVSVSKNLIVTGKDLSVSSEPVEVTLEIERKLAQAYKEFEKTYNNRYRGISGGVKIPDIKCAPCYVDGKRVLTEWEKAVLRGDLVYDKGEVKIVKYEEVKKDTHKELVFTNETQRERVEAYLEEYKDVTYVPNWIIHGFNSRKDAINAAMKAVQKSVGVNNSGLGV